MAHDYAPPLTHPAVEYVREFLALRFPLSVRPEDRWIVNLSGYFDASRTHGSAPVFSLAGFLGRADDWGAFTYKWSEAMTAMGLDYFHMATFESRKREYEGWTNEERQARLNYLLKLILDFSIVSVGISIPLTAYDVIFTEDELPPPPNQEWLSPGIAAPHAPRPGDAPPHPPDQKPGLIRRKSGGPYGLAASVLFRDVAEHLHGIRGVGDPFVAYTFEAGDLGFGQVSKVFQDNYADDNSRRDLRLGSLHFEDKRKFPPLQAADILAYELAKHLPRQLGLDELPTRYPLRVLHGQVHSWGRLEASEIEKWHDVLGKGLHYSTGTWHK